MSVYRNWLFRNLTHLTTLNLNYNVLGPFMSFTKISASVFHGLKSLKCLWMTNNFIKHLDKNLLKDNVYLEELHINKNEIESWT